MLGSCSKDFLDTRPVGRVLEVNYYQTQDQAFEALVSVYDVLQWNDQWGFTMFRFLQNVASDDTYAYVSSEATFCKKRNMVKPH